MKIKDGYILREIADSLVVVPIGSRVIEFNGLMLLNESGSLLWNKLQEGAETDDLVKVFLDEYDVDENTARADVTEFLNELNLKGLLQQ